MSTQSQEPPDLNQADSYLDHLTQMSEITQVIASEDILNDFGVLLVPKGTRIKKSVADRLSGHRMEKPIDDTVAVENLINYQQLEQDIYDLIDRYPDFIHVHEKFHFTNKLKHLCSVSNIPRVLLQKLSVLKARLEPVYQRSLFAAWFGALIGNEMDWGSKQVHQIFLTGLYHDLGLLHLPPDIVGLTQFNEQQWRLMKSHVLISRKIVENASLYEESLLDAIVQHHERCDGTGYPKKLTAKKLDILGQIIALCDHMYNVRTGEYESSGKTLLDFKPYLQVNTETYFHQTYQATFSILSRSGLSHGGKENTEDFQALLDKLLKRSQLFLNIRDLSIEFLSFLEKFELGKNGIAMQAGILRSNRVIQSSGLIGPEMEKWLTSISQAEFADCAEELNNIEALQLELLWLSKKSSRLMPDFYKNELPDEMKENDRFKQVSMKIEKLLQECWQL